MVLVLWIISYLTIASDHISAFSFLNQMKPASASSVKHTVDHIISSNVSQVLVHSLWLCQCEPTETLPVLIKRLGEACCICRSDASMFCCLHN